LDSLAWQLKKNGYYTAAHHGNRQTFWNRNVMYETEGYDEFYDLSDYENDEIIAMGLSDKSFLRQTVEKLKNFKKPYFSFIVTITSHFPFGATQQYGDFPVGEYEGTVLGDYLKAIHYTDKQLGMFLDELKKSGIMDESIVMLYGDHSAIPQKDADLLYQYTKITDKNDFQWQKLQKVPFMIHFPEDQYKGVSSLYTGQIEIYPTIANLFNLDPAYTLGKDMLNSYKGKVIFRNGSFTNGDIFYIASEDRYYDIKNGEEIHKTEELNHMKNEYMEDLQYSDDLLNKDLILEFEEDGD
jgi:lipoteichoic acid synthase